MYDFQELNFDLDGDGVPDAHAEGMDGNGDGVEDMILIDGDGDGAADIVLLDMDGDGRCETIANDIDGNGVFDTFYTELDTNGDGVVDQVAAYHDYNQDGVIDGGKIYSDLNGDGRFDVRIQQVDTDGDSVMDQFVTHIDLDGDGQADQIVEEQLADTNKDGIPDTYIQAIDSDADGTFDSINLYDYDAAAGTLTPIDLSGADAAPETVVELDTFDPESADPEHISGDPAADMENWEYQGSTNRCTLFSQKFVIEELTDQEIDVEQMADIAEENGWFTEEDGGNLLSMNKMLDYYGVENEMTFYNGEEDLRHSLENGNKVIVGVDADEIWYGETDEMFSPADGANHAVQVIGIDDTNPDCPMVILNDSGSPNGCGEMVPMDVFLDAWEDSDCQMIVCCG